MQYKMQYWYVLTRGIESFDSNIPCKNCIVKLVCTESCVEWEKQVNTWDIERYERCRNWLKKQLLEED